MKIAVVGNHTQHHCSEVHWSKTLRVMGHTVTQIQENTQPDVAAGEKLVDGHDVMIYVRCWGWGPLFDTAALLRIEKRGTLTMGLHLDRFWGLKRWTNLVAPAEPPRDPMFDCQLVCTADGDAPWEKVGVHHHWLPPGVYGPECYDADPVPDYMDIDVAFAGSWRSYHPEWPHRQQLIEHLDDWYGKRFTTFPAFGEPAIRGHELNQLYASIPVFVGDSCFMSADGHYWSDRFAETYGRGGFLVFPRNRSLIGELDAGLYPSWRIGEWDHLRSTIDQCLAMTPDERDVWRTRIATVVRSRMTYRERLAEALYVLTGGKVADDGRLHEDEVPVEASGEAGGDLGGAPER